MQQAGSASKTSGPRPRDLRRGLRARRRVLGLASLCLPGLVIFATDLARRASRIAAFHGGYRWLHAGTVLGSLLFWGLLLYVAATRRGVQRRVAAMIFVLFFTLAFAVQNAFFGHYGVYVAIDPLILGDDLARGLVATLPFDRPPLALLIAITLGLALAMLGLARRYVRPVPRARLAATIASAGALVLAFAAPVQTPVSTQAASPDLMYFHGYAVFVNEHARRKVYRVKPQIVRVQRRTPLAVPPLNPRLPATRNVVLLLQEAQRADVTCIAYTAGCALATRASNPLAPGRIPFLQARAAASSTAVAVAALWSGIDPTESYDTLHSAPLVWEYARAGGYDGAYWTSQNAMFGNSRLYVQDLPVSAFATGTGIDPRADVLTGADDEKLVDRVIEDWPKLQEPFFAVVHFSNIHRPRVVDRDDLPFRPTHLEDKGTGSVEGRNYYRNAVYRSDRAVARLIRHIRSTQAGYRTVLVYTADHGEAFGEHRNENDHSATVYDEEIRVPFWIDAPVGVLSEQEVEGYRKNWLELVSQYDQAATLLGLLGIWDDPSFAPFRRRMLGTPVDRPLAERAVPLTNVSWVWEYHRPNWGMMQGSFKVLAQIEDADYLCFDVQRDPLEKRPLKNAACASLTERARETYGMLPKDMRRLRDHPEWGGGSASRR